MTNSKRLTERLAPLQKQIDDLAEARKEIDEFAREIQSRKKSVASLQAENDQKFDFDRDLKLQDLKRVIENAEKSLATQKKVYAEKVKKANDSQIKINFRKAVSQTIQQDEEVEKGQMAVDKALTEAYKTYTDYVELVTDKTIKLFDNFNDSGYSYVFDNEVDVSGIGTGYMFPREFELTLKSFAEKRHAKQWVK